jgi:hypothetical protein
MLGTGKTLFYQEILGKELTPVYIRGRILIAVADLHELVERLRG